MLFTPLHKAVGRNPGPIEDEFLDAAVEAAIAEADGIDWKRAAPAVKDLTQSDFPKDVAAMANSGGGVIVFGIEENQKAATGRADVGALDQEKYARALRSAAVTAISPPVFGLEVVFVGDEGKRAVAVVVPASVDGPHLIYRNEYFGAPIRNDADTVWMKEREIERMYRARFDEQRHVHEALDALYEEAVAGCSAEERGAWVVSVARPRVAVDRRGRMDEKSARSILDAADGNSGRQVGWNAWRPINDVDGYRPRPGLRRWLFDNRRPDRIARRSVSASVHFDGAVTLTALVSESLGTSDSSGAAIQVAVSAMEGSISDMVGLVRASGDAIGADEFEVRVGIKWTGGPLELINMGRGGRIDESSIVERFSPVEVSLRVRSDEPESLTQTREIALDVINQCGLSALVLLDDARRL